MATKTVIVVSLLAAAVYASEYQVGNACMVQYLKGKGLLDESFPSDNPSPYCRLAIAPVMQGLEKGFKAQLASKEGVKTECIYPKLNDAGFVDQLMKLEVLMASNGDKSETERLLKETKASIRQTLDTAASDCDSDPNYGDVFSNIIPSNNQSLAVLQRDYCLLKHLTAGDFLRLTIENENPNNIETTNLDCAAVIKADQGKAENEKQALIEKSMPSKSMLNCVMKTFRESHIYEKEAALKYIDAMNSMDSDVKAERMRISESLKTFVHGIFACALNM